GRFEAEISQSMQQVGEALVTLLPRARRHPKDRACAAAIPRQHRGAGPPFAGEDARSGRHSEARRVEGLLPDDGQLGSARVYNAAHTYAILAAAESERFGDRRFAFENEKGSTLDPAGPHVRGGSGRPEYEDFGELRVLSDETDRGKDLRPWTLIQSDYGNVRLWLAGEGAAGQ